LQKKERRPESSHTRQIQRWRKKSNGQKNSGRLHDYDAVDCFAPRFASFAIKSRTARRTIFPMEASCSAAILSRAAFKSGLRRNLTSASSRVFVCVFMRPFVPQMGAFVHKKIK
jgi:hypothetical protein